LIRLDTVIDVSLAARVGVEKGDRAGLRF